MPRALSLPVAKEKSSEIGQFKAPRQETGGDYAALIRGRITPSGIEQYPEGGRHEVGRQ